MFALRAGMGNYLSKVFELNLKLKYTYYTLLPFKLNQWKKEIQ